MLQFRFLMHDSPDVKPGVYSRLAAAIPCSFRAQSCGLPRCLIVCTVLSLCLIPDDLIYGCFWRTNSDPWCSSLGCPKLRCVCCTRCMHAWNLPRLLLMETFLIHVLLCTHTFTFTLQNTGDNNNTATDAWWRSSNTWSYCLILSKFCSIFILL